VAGGWWLVAGGWWLVAGGWTSIVSYRLDLSKRTARTPVGMVKRGDDGLMVFDFLGVTQK
jgi:hypothetical protein